MSQLELFIRNGDRERALSIDAFASIIGVSAATVRNWMRLGVLPADLSIKRADEVKRALSTGELNRLGKRANKTKSKLSSVPTEYAVSQGAVEAALSIARTVGTNSLSIENSLFVLAMRLLVLRKEVVFEKPENALVRPLDGTWRRAAVRHEMEAWLGTLNTAPSKRYFVLHQTDLTFEGEDFLGLTYQTMLHEGHKSSAGSYYTPTPIARAAIEAYAGKPSSAFLDPCCGTGQYLLLAANILGLPIAAVQGCDRDPIAVRIARLNVLLAYPLADATPNVECRDVLQDLEYRPSVDLIATNPPWGSEKNSRNGAAAQEYAWINSSETFVLFIMRCIGLLKDGGRLSFLLPESFLNIRTHASIREFLLREVTLKSITPLGRAFSGVYTKAIRLDLEKTKPCRSASVIIKDGAATKSVEQKRFLQNSHFVVDLSVDEDDYFLLKKIFARDHVTLKNQALWALGVVTGNNKAFLRDTPDKGREPIFRGSDIERYLLGTPRTFVEFVPERFQQVAKPELYRAEEKLVYRFISSRLTFAYDDQKRLMLNSANILIPMLPGMRIKAALAFLNSDVFQFIFSKKFSTHKVLRGDLEALPFPTLSSSIQSKLEACVDGLLRGKDQAPQVNDLVFESFGLSDEDRQLISAHLT
jgi:SAM-dependent methyltransferase